MTPQTLIQLCSQELGVPIADLKGRGRQEHVALARQMAMAMMREHCFDGHGKPMTYCEIGRQFGNRDHGTVLHACRKIHGLALNEKAAHATLAKLRKILDQSSIPQDFSVHIHATLLINNGNKCYEAKVERLSDAGDYVKLTIKGDTDWYPVNQFRIRQVVK